MLLGQAKVDFILKIKNWKNLGKYFHVAKKLHWIKRTWTLNWKERIKIDKPLNVIKQNFMTAY